MGERISTGGEDATEVIICDAAELSFCLAFLMVMGACVGSLSNNSLDLSNQI